MKLWATVVMVAFTTFSTTAMAMDMTQVTGLNHEKIDLNPSEVVRLQYPAAVRQGHFPEAARCVIYTTDGKFISVLEDCIEVRKRLNATK